MEEKRTRYITTIFTLDRISQALGLITWDDADLSDFINSYEKHYGLKMISPQPEILITVEYTNIIWNYRILYGSYKKKYKPIQTDDERWTKIENQIESDLKMIGLDKLKEEILSKLKNKTYFEYKTKINIQFKKYCV